MIRETHIVKDAAVPYGELPFLQSPVTGNQLVYRNNGLVDERSGERFEVTPLGIPLFAEKFLSAEAAVQKKHYDTIQEDYVDNLEAPYTQEYNLYLDKGLLDAMAGQNLTRVAEVCCGSAEGFKLLSANIGFGVGVDISPAMLATAKRNHPDGKFFFIQGDATSLPLRDSQFDCVIMLGGIHHVPNRAALFSEIKRILRPGGKFYFREPVDDFFLWRWLRYAIYRVSPLLDANTEAPLRRRSTEAALNEAGLRLTSWKTFGFLGFCFFMNSDVLVFNRFLKFLPGIRPLTRLVAKFDELSLRIPGMAANGLQVVGVAEKE